MSESGLGRGTAKTLGEGVEDGEVPLKARGVEGDATPAHGDLAAAIEQDRRRRLGQRERRVREALGHSFHPLGAGGGDMQASRRPENVVGEDAQTRTVIGDEVGIEGE